MNKFKGQWLNQCLRYLIVSLLVLAIGVIPSFAGNKVFFYHTDAAGTPVAMSDANGDVVWRADYMPFGEEHEITGSVKNKRRFIGKEKDEETDLYYFGARYLDARTGRFIKPDPVGIREADLLNPQRLNRYSYSLNNPYRYIDPDGNIPLPLLIIPVVTAIIGGNLMTPDVANTPTMPGDIHEGPSDLDVLVGTATGAAIGTTIVGKGVAAAGKEIVEEVTGVPTSYKPKRSLPRDKHGRKIPDSVYPHTQLGEKTSKRTGETYRQTREWGARGNRGYDERTPIKDTDWTDHHRPDLHNNPHDHPYNPKTGKRL